MHNAVSLQPLTIRPCFNQLLAILLVLLLLFYIAHPNTS